MAAIVGVVAVRAALHAADLVQRARLSLVQVQDVGRPDAAVAGPLLASAARDLAQAERTLSAPVPALVAHLPLLGRSLSLERLVVDSARSTVRAASVAVQGTAGLRRPGSPTVDTHALGRLGAALRPVNLRAQRDLAGLQAAPTGLVPSQVADAVGQARESLGPAVRSLRALQDGALLARSLLGGAGSRSVLVALQNNAELRGAGGYVSTFATGRVTGGRLSLSPFRDVSDYYELPGRSRKVPAPREYVEDYGPYLADTTLWRTWTMSPNVPDVGQVGAAVAGTLLGERPDTVVVLDVPALATLAQLSGGVRVAGTVLAGKPLLDALLVDAYAAAGAGLADQFARRAALQRAASQAVVGVLSSSAPALQTARTLAGLTSGRHLAVWSARASDRPLLAGLGLDGAVDAAGSDLVSINVNNLNANKLDYYVRRDVSVEVTVGRPTTTVVQRVRLLNRAPAGLVPYVAGFVTPRVALERVEFSIAPDARIVQATIGRRPARGTVRRGAHRTRVALTVRLRPGVPVDLELTLQVPTPTGDYRATLLPQPLAEDAGLHLRVRPARGAALARVEGAELRAGVASREEGFAERSTLRAALAPAGGPGPWARLRRWWNSPVDLS